MISNYVNSNPQHLFIGMRYSFGETSLSWINGLKCSPSCVTPGGSSLYDSQSNKVLLVFYHGNAVYITSFNAGTGAFTDPTGR